MDDFNRARQVNTGYGRPTFSKVEMRDIAIAILVLTVSFTIIYRNVRLFSDDFVTNILCWFLTSLILVITSFMLHELGHKFTAQKFGAWSEFRMFPAGLVLCLVMSFIGFLFAAPGAVYIRGFIDDKMNGKISAAGPAVNLVICFISLILMLIFSGNNILLNIFYLLAHLNAFLALFNLIPLGPLDGGKVMKWNFPLWAGMLAASIILLFVVRYAAGL